MFILWCLLPAIKLEKNIHSLPGRILITDRHWEVITNVPKPEWYFKKYTVADGDTIFLRDLISIEDNRFYTHSWVSIFSKLRAFKDNISWKKLSGWSTLTEQYVKNIYFLWSKRSYLQKIREAVIALYIETQYSKEEILESYVNEVYFWNRIYWIWAALEQYFEKEYLYELTEHERVLLLWLLHVPGTQSTSEKYFTGYYNKIAQRLWYKVDVKKTELKWMKKDSINIFPHITSRAIAEACGKVHYDFSILFEWVESSCWREIQLQTSIDKNLQLESKNILQEELKKLEWKNVTNGAVYWIIPESKKILLYQWSQDFHSELIDWEVDIIASFNQPWSTVKPFLYLFWLLEWYWSETLLLDIESEYNSFQSWKTYTSENYSLKEYGLVRYKKALGNSLNNATVRLGSELGLNNVYKFYKSYWFEFDYWPEHYGYSLVLWNADITLDDLVHNYSKLLIHDEDSNKLRRAKFLLKNILEDPDNRDISFGVNSLLNTSIPQAVKTWTSSEFRDNLVVSYHKDLVLGVWVWNNDNSSMTGVTWITWAWTIWNKVIEEAISWKYIQKWEEIIPEWVIESDYCLDTKCFRKEIIYTKKGREYWSRLKDKFYSWKDILQMFSSFEENRLVDLGINIWD